MDPKAQFSPQIGPPWTPPVWACGPDKLIADAQQQLWQDSSDVQVSALGGGDRAMSGYQTAPQNESDEMIPAAPAGRAEAWTTSLRDLFREEPLSAWANGSHDGPANPPA